jgi:hypothetical protein
MQARGSRAATAAAAKMMTLTVKQLQGWRRMAMLLQLKTNQQQQQPGRSSGLL